MEPGGPGESCSIGQAERQAPVKTLRLVLFARRYKNAYTGCGRDSG
jgi:hypothetical protein